jgi:hypothetical protein
MPGLDVSESSFEGAPNDRMELTGRDRHLAAAGQQAGLAELVAAQQLVMSR